MAKFAFISFVFPPVMHRLLWVLQKLQKRTVQTLIVFPRWYRGLISSLLPTECSYITRSSYFYFILFSKRAHSLFSLFLVVATLRWDFVLDWPNTLIVLCSFALKNMFWLGHNPIITSAKRCSFYPI